MERGYDCITPTLRLHDISPAQTSDPSLGTTSLLDYAKDLEEEIKKLDTEPIIMGHSMGGLLAQILGSRGLAKSLVLLTPAPPAGISALKYSVIKSFWGSFTRWGFWRKAHRFSFDEAAYAVLNLLPGKEQEEVYSKFVYESGKAAAEIGFWYLDSQGASKVDESKITCPVLVIAGKHDRITPASISRKIAKKYKAVSTYKEYPNHAHWVVGLNQNVK